MRLIYSGAWVERDRETHKIPGRCSASSITSVGAQSIAGRCSYRRLIPASRRSSEPWRLSTDSPFHAMEVMPDHVRLFIAAVPTRSVAEIVNRFKGRTSRLLRDEFKSLRSRLPTLWSRSYFAATVGAVSEAAIRRYIETQK